MAPVQHYVPQFLLRNFCAGAKPKIYLPVSSTRTLAFFCRSHEEMVRDGVERMRTIMVRDSGHSMGFGDLLKWRRAFRTGVPLSSSNCLNAFKKWDWSK